MGSSSKKIGKGLIWTVAYNIISALYGFISVPLLISHYGKDEYGLIGLALSINVFMQLMDLGFNNTNIRFYSIWLNKNDKTKLVRGFKSSLAFYGLIGFLNSSILLIILIFAKDIFAIDATHTIILKKLIAVLTVSAFINWYSSCFDQLIKSTENIDWIQRRSIIPKLFQIIILFVTLKFNLSITLFFAFTTFSFLIIIRLTIKKIKSLLPFISFKPQLDISILKEILPYSIGIFSFGFFQFSFNNLRPVFLGIEGSLSDVSDYRVISGVIGIVSLFSGMFLSVLLPSTSKIIATDNKRAFYDVAYSGTKYITIVTAMMCFGIMSVSPELLDLYVGHAYKNQSYLKLVPWLNLWLLCMLSAHNQAISSLILAGSKVKAVAWISAISSVTGLSASWLLITHYGIGGVIYGLVLYTSVQLSFYYFYYWPKYMGIDSKVLFIKSVLPYLVIGSGCYFIIQLLPEAGNSWIDLLYKGIIFILIYLIASLLSLSRQDRIFITTNLIHR